jgi:hypothetical protein
MTCRHVCAALAALAASATAFSQQDIDSAMARYERAIAACNSGNLPRPERDACVRDAGQAWDQAQRGLPPGADVTSPAGRATVVVPRGSLPPRTDSDTITSPDGDSTIVLPSDGSRPISQ